MSDLSDDDTRRSRLLGVKLRTLVAEHTGRSPVPEPSAFAPGSALTVDGVAWVLLDDDPPRRLGAALAWTLRQGVDEVTVIADVGTGVLARRAAEFELPIAVWHAEQRTLLPAVPEPLVVPAPAPVGHDALRALIVEGGARPLVEHGVLFGEVRGLEVCRVVDDASMEVTRLEVGVGAHDREAFQMLHGDLPPAESLARIVAEVERHRAVGAPQHPLNRLAAERFLRWRVEQDPSIVGAVAVAPAPPPVPRPNLKDPTPCVAWASPTTGPVTPETADTVVVVASGVDLDLIPYAADARLSAEQAGVGVERLVVVLPARDRVRILDELAAALRRPVEFVTIG